MSLSATSRSATLQSDPRLQTGVPRVMLSKI